MFRIGHCIRVIAVAIGTLGGAACGNTFSPDGFLELEATAAVYTPGEIIELRVKNIGHDDLLLGMCPTAIYPVLDPSAVIGFPNPCPAIAVELGPGDETRIVGRLPTDLPAGSYRIGFGYDGQIAQSQVIEVRS